jgi:hypothetical protein
MSLQEIRRFIEQSRINQRNWRRIRVMGGEPTLHPDLLPILKELLDYSEGLESSVKIELVSNGYSDSTKKILKSLPKGIIEHNTEKTSHLQASFDPINMAPIDNRYYRLTDFSNSCWITEYCGMGLTINGYYHCAVAGAIDRVFHLGLGEEELPRDDFDFKLQKRRICQFCGHFHSRRYIPPAERVPISGNPCSSSWIEAYANNQSKGEW